ncbi:MAG: CvpA family protein [Holosporaceae bacterium]|jgi:membrane protein required for colicin V production|nr:CvpA family protein [Holosporaceae bacterium]
MSNGEFFNSLDYIYIALMFFSTVAGFIRGFVKDFLSSCAWFGSGFVATLVAPYFIHAIGERIPNSTIARCVAFGISYLVVLVIFLLIIGAMSRNVKGGILSGIDRAVGVLFGLFRGVGLLVCFCVLMIIFEIPRDKYEMMRDSKLSPILFEIAESLTPKITKFAPIIEKNKTLVVARKKKTIIEEALQIIKETKKEKKIAEEDRFAILQRIKDFIAEILARRQIEEPPAKILSVIPQTPQIVNGPKYGSMSLIEARARRRYQRKVEKSKREIRKHLDIKNP